MPPVFWLAKRLRSMVGCSWTERNGGTLRWLLGEMSALIFFFGFAAAQCGKAQPYRSQSRKVLWLCLHWGEWRHSLEFKSRLSVRGEPYRTVRRQSRIWRMTVLKQKYKLGGFLLALLMAFNSIMPPTAYAQDARELDQERIASRKLKGEHPLVGLMRSCKSALRPELAGIHPRVFVTES